MSYIERTLTNESIKISESELKLSSKVILILAEPGAGKTALLKNLEIKTNGKFIRAKTFKHASQGLNNRTLLIDGLDEIAKQGGSSIEEIIIKAMELNSDTLVLSCRASEWDKSFNSIFDEYGKKYEEYFLKPFNEEEQNRYFSLKFPNENFSDLKETLNKFELTPLLGNPLFIYVFGLAYSNKKNEYEFKLDIFKSAIDVLAKENNQENKVQLNRPNVKSIIDLAGELFSNLLLSGASGVSVNEFVSSIDFPHLYSISSKENTKLKWVLDSQFFIPVSDANLYEPIHRVIAEFVSAKYIVSRLEDPMDKLSLNRLLSLVAPNRVVRDDLRGLLGWITTLGDEATQRECIHLDPFAIIANGDAANLKAKIKVELLKSLGDLSATDPYFLRSDRFRKFMVKDFVCSDTIPLMKNYLANINLNTDLLLVLLNLLSHSQLIEPFKTELLGLIKSKKVNIGNQKQALNIFINTNAFDFIGLFDCLIRGEVDKQKLELACSIVKVKATFFTAIPRLARLFEKLTNFFPKTKNEASTFVSKYFIKSMVNALSIKQVESLIETLSKRIKCSCEAKHSFECHCRNGISKLIGKLLDRYFSLNPKNVCENKLLQWLMPLNFHRRPMVGESACVEWLTTHNKVRRGMQKQLFSKCSTENEIWELKNKLYRTYGLHCGLSLMDGDVIKIIEYAFAENKLDLWKAFHCEHLNQISKPNEIRHLMRIQAMESPMFMEVWAKSQHYNKKHRKLDREPRYYFERKRKLKENKVKQANLSEFKNNENKILAGEHWGFLLKFAFHLLLKGDYILEYLPYDNIPKKALLNSLHYLKQYTPTLKELSKRNMAGGISEVLIVLVAACLCIYRKNKNLHGVDLKILAAVKVEYGTGFDGITDEEYESFFNEVDNCLFRDKKQRGSFLNEYVEPQLNGHDNSHPSVDLLHREPFKEVAGYFARRWLLNFCCIPHYAENELFNILAKNCSGEVIKYVIQHQCAIFKERFGPLTRREQKHRIFWFLRRFLYCDDFHEEWNFISSDENNLFLLKSLVNGRRFGSEFEAPVLSEEKIKLVLSTLVNSLNRGDRSELASDFVSFLINLLPSTSESLLLLNIIVKDERYKLFHKLCSHNITTILRNLALKNFTPPEPDNIFEFLNEYRIANVVDARALVLEQLQHIQQEYKYSSTTPLKKFYSGGKRIDENTARDRIVEDLKPKLASYCVDVEQHMANSDRCDIAVKAKVGFKQIMLTIEVKGQWHKELFIAATNQLFNRYAQHPDAENQGLYLVLWFGKDEQIANRKNIKFSTPEQLKLEIESNIVPELRNQIDVFVLDLSLN